MSSATISVTAALAILFGVPLVVFASLAFVVWLMQRPRRRAESDLEAAMVAGDVEGAKALLRVRGELLSLDALEEAEAWIEEMGEQV